MAQPLSATLKKFADMSKKLNYKDQAIFFLNAYWSEYSKEAETVWDYTHKFEELDAKQHEDGYALDEFQSHRFLELMGQVLTVVDMRKVLKEIDIDTDLHMSLLEYSVYRYKLDIDTLMTRPQGVNEQVLECEKICKDIQKSLVLIKSKRSKWDGKPIPEDGPKKIAYTQDQKILDTAEQDLVQKLDLASRKLGAAQKSKDIQAQGKLWWLNREMEEAKKYAAPKKQLK